MTLPTIHLNGTSAQDLYDQAEAVFHALREAMRLMQQAAPNGRDYYPQGPGAIEQAQGEHCLRLHAIQTVVEQYEKLMEQASDHMARGR